MRVEIESGESATLAPGAALAFDTGATDAQREANPRLFIGALVVAELIWLCAGAYLILRFLF